MIENALLEVDGVGRPRFNGDGGGSVCDLAAVGRAGGDSSSSSSTVKDCLSFEGEVIGEGPDLPGGVEGLPMTVDGEDGEEGRRKSEGRDELKDRGDGLYAEACITDCQLCERRGFFKIFCTIASLQWADIEVDQSRGSQKQQLNAHMCKFVDVESIGVASVL